jgi:hypothetical protein
MAITKFAAGGCFRSEWFKEFEMQRPGEMDIVQPARKRATCYRHMPRMRAPISMWGPWLAASVEAADADGQVVRSNMGRSDSGMNLVRAAYRSRRLYYGNVIRESTRRRMTGQGSYPVQGDTFSWRGRAIVTTLSG